MTEEVVPLTQNNGKTEILKKKSVVKAVKGKNGGARPGAGRKKGSLNKATKEKKEVENAFTQRVLTVANKLFESQLTIAQGASFLYRIDKDEKGNNKKPVLVTNEWEIEQYLNGENFDPSTYYYITTERPDNKAIDSMLDRVFGKATQKTEITGADGEPLKVELVSYADNNDTAPV